MKYMIVWSYIEVLALVLVLVLLDLSLKLSDHNIRFKFENSLTCSNGHEAMSKWNKKKKNMHQTTWQNRNHKVNRKVEWMWTNKMN